MYNAKGRSRQTPPFMGNMKKLLAAFAALCVLAVFGTGALGVFGGVLGVLRVVHEIYLHFLYHRYGVSVAAGGENIHELRNFPKKSVDKPPRIV